MKWIKNKLRKWLEIPTIPKHNYTEEFEATLQKATNRLDRSFTQRIARFSVIDCSVCGKHLIAGRDSIYTNYKGIKFCSHECIENN